MQKTIAVIRGDGIGPEIISGALLVLNAVAAKFGHRFTYNEVLVGGAAIDATGAPFSEAALATCKAADAVLLGAVGGPKWDDLPAEKRPEKALFGLRSGLGLYTNLRPAILMKALAAASPLRSDIVEKGIDFLVVRELTGGIYFGARKTEQVEGEQVATDTMVYSESEIERIVVAGFEAAMGRRKKLCSVDKANVLDCSRLWRKVAHRVAKDYPQVEYSDMLVDNAAMQLVRAPWQFDVIVTENMFGDILSDEASMLTGSIGLLPSASLGAPGTPGLFEPIHGSAPDIAGTDKANPIGTILSAAMLLRHGLGMIAEADAVEAAVNSALTEGLRTADTAAPGQPATGCKAAAEIIAAKIGE